ncbi:hypothetical protein PR048_030106 [Dryococelus australis]|uniref:Uncharacterized protein n=1 Tax=Dryococelus australis TaxID=614101 RepID=A0ABQ9G7Z9_9NEOP|nr:hypothetical protein PR048_030106 [Dryococelus australis]
MLFTMIDGKCVTQYRQHFPCVASCVEKRPRILTTLIRYYGGNKLILSWTLYVYIAYNDIRLFECILHLSYKLTIGKWQAHSDEEETICELGLIVDRPKPGNGSDNDGNTARVTGVDVPLVKISHVILQAISSGHEINFNSFHDYPIETAMLYIQPYSWYSVPTSVH